MTKHKVSPGKPTYHHLIQNSKYLRRATLLIDPIERSRSKKEKKQQEIMSHRIEELPESPLPIIPSNIENKECTEKKWEEIKNQNDFLFKLKACKLKMDQAENQQVEEYLEELKKNLATISEENVCAWITNQNQPIETTTNKKSHLMKTLYDFFNDKNNFSLEEIDKKLLLLGAFEIYAKFRAKEPQVKTLTGKVMSFFVAADQEGYFSVCTGAYKLNAVKAIQLALMSYLSLADIVKSLDEPTSVLYKYKKALTEKGELNCYFNYLQILAGANTKPSIEVVNENQLKIN